MDKTLLANNSQHYWMLHVTSLCIPCCRLLRVVGSCCARFETGQTFELSTPSFFFCSVIAEAQRNNVKSICKALLLGPSMPITQSWSAKSYGLYPSHNLVQVPTMLGVVASVCAPLPTRTQQPPMFQGKQHCLSFCPFAVA